MERSQDFKRKRDVKSLDKPSLIKPVFINEGIVGHRAGIARAYPQRWAEVRIEL
jgi:hypothetical protein